MIDLSLGKDVMVFMTFCNPEVFLMKFGNAHVKPNLLKLALAKLPLGSIGVPAIA